MGFGGVVASSPIGVTGLTQKHSGYVWGNPKVLPILGQIQGKTVSLIHYEFDEQTTRLCERQLSKVIARMHQQRTQQNRVNRG